MTFMHYDLEELLPENHQIRKIEKTVSFASLAYRLKDLDKKLGRKGYGAEVGLRCLYTTICQIEQWKSSLKIA